jgi:hypothetical protein
VLCFFFLGLFCISFFFLFVFHCFLFFICIFLPLGFSFNFSYTPSHVAFLWNQSSQQHTFVAPTTMTLCMVVVAIVFLFCRVSFQAFLSSSCLFHHCSFFLLCFFLLACHFSIPMYSSLVFMIN